MNFDKYILITGGAGFIGSHLIRKFVNDYGNYFIINIDKLTYASNLENISDVQDKPNYHFINGDITDRTLLKDVFNQFSIDSIIHLAAESHVDNSIENPLLFVQTNIVGTINLLEEARCRWGSSKASNLFYGISTDEVFGSLGKLGEFSEDSPYLPKSPYSASKASADHFIRAYGNTYNIPFIISNCSNNYGPNQHTEKLIPLSIKNLIDRKKIPIYGDGQAIRDWIFVLDHVDAIDCIFHKGHSGETYNVGANNELKNIELVKLICSVIDKKMGFKNSEDLIELVTDRPGHDKRYAIDSTKIHNQLYWSPKTNFLDGLELTIDWYLKKLIKKPR